jgi:NADPH:quinone reductase-like Zn-dependent oxidoreductase/cytochrome P450
MLGRRDTSRRLGDRAGGRRRGHRRQGDQGAIASHVTVDARYVFRKPPAMSFEEACQLPIAFLTAWYALARLARVEKGDKVLIHSATGGTGLACVQVAQMLGAEIFATAGSEEKQDYLRTLGVVHVMPSRSLDFADHIRSVTGGRGVDVVVNSLAGEAVSRGMACLAPYGRFVEIGKRDFLADANLHLRPFLDNLSYFSFDLRQMLADRPDRVRDEFLRLLEEFETGRLRPSPHRLPSGAGPASLPEHGQRWAHRQAGDLDAGEPGQRHPPAEASRGVRRRNLAARRGPRRIRAPHGRTPRPQGRTSPGAAGPHHYPVHWSDELGRWVLTRYEDAIQVLRGTQFTSRPKQHRGLLRYGLSFLDGDDHTRIRRLLNPYFTREAGMHTLEQLEDVTDGFVQQMLDAREFDFVTGFATPFSIGLITQILDLPVADGPLLARWTTDVVTAEGITTTAQARLRSLETYRTMSRYVQQFLDDMPAGGDEDLRSALLRAHRDRVLTTDELSDTVMELILGTLETTPALLSSGLLALLRNPAEAGKLTEDPFRVSNAVEEMLRYEAPFQFANRISRRKG